MDAYLRCVVVGSLLNRSSLRACPRASCTACGPRLATRLSSRRLAEPALGRRGDTDGDARRPDMPLLTPLMPRTGGRWSDMDSDVVVPVMSVPAGVLRRGFADRVLVTLPDLARCVIDRGFPNSPTPYLCPPWHSHTRTQGLGTAWARLRALDARVARRVGGAQVRPTRAASGPTS